MKSITTLVSDIQQRLLSNKAPSDERVKELGCRIADAVAEQLRGKGGNDKLRMSNFSTPDRKLWYSCNTPEDAEPVSPEARLNFMYGGVVEEIMLFLSKEAGHDVKHEQKEVELNGVLGHIDGVIDGVLVDVKSANSRSFDKFKYHRLDSDDPFGYRDQLSLYVRASEDLPDVKIKKQGAFLAVDKERGQLVLDTYTSKDTDYEKETIRKRSMLNERVPPPRCYLPVPDGKSGNLKLGVECSYCPFKKKCWPEMRTFLYSDGPRHLVRVEREPDVDELKRDKSE
jgi:hypothetical protein